MSPCFLEDFGTTALPAQETHRTPPPPQILAKLADEALAQALSAFAAQHGSTAAGLALGFCLRDPRVTTVLVGARNGAQLRENIAGALQSQPAAVWRQLESMFPA